MSERRKCRSRRGPKPRTVVLARVISNLLALTVRLLASQEAMFFEVEVNLRPTISRPVCLRVRRPSGTRDQFFFFL
jgi:hypothetical protein